MATALVPNTDVAGMARPAGELDVRRALAPYAGPWNGRLAAHLLRRAGFGGTPSEIASLAAMPVHQAVDQLLNLPAADAIAPAGSLYSLSAAIAQLFPNGRPKDVDDMERRRIFEQIRMGERDSIISVQNWWLNRMLATPAPLQEKMTLFFHGHFTSAAIQKGVDPQMIFAQNQLFREYALGNLRDLTWQVSIDPAMLIYLDNATNVAKHPNENYARELMELFTLGVDHYTENDVRESARAWSGWIVNRRTGAAQFVPGRHDDGTKTFLGQTGNWTGQDIVSIIYRQPACAMFWANTLLNFFVYNDPEPALVSSLANAIRAHDFELRPIMSMLLRSNVFFSQRAYRALVKSPVEFTIGTYKALELTEVGLQGQRALTQMGQVLFYPPNVAGWPGGANWLTTQTMIARANFVASIVNSPAMTDASWLQSVPMRSQEAARVLVERMLLGDASGSALAQLSAYLDGSNTSALGVLSPENFQERLRGGIYLTMAMPAYQLG